MGDEQAASPGTPGRTIVLTFDNLGEASALERGSWDPATHLGEDPSVTVALPRLLNMLDRHGLVATFFVEAINCELNPDAVREIAARGHELGVHGWRHETWSELDPPVERALLQRSTRAFAALDVPRPRAFRPPGGGVTAATYELLRTHGYDWCSPEGETPSRDGGLVTIPFTWELVDAYHRMDSFSDLRRRRGDDAATADPATAAARLRRGLDAPGTHTLILHPFLMLDHHWCNAVEGLLRELAAAGDAWVTAGGRLADRLGG